MYSSVMNLLCITFYIWKFKYHYTVTYPKKEVHDMIIYYTEIDLILVITSTYIYWYTWVLSELDVEFECPK